MKLSYILIVLALICALVILSLALAPVVAGAQPSDWDRSSLKAEGVCLEDGTLRVTVTNVGQDMQGPVDYRFAVNDVVVASGTLQLNANESIVIDSPALPDVLIEFSVDQRPGHPGTGIAFVRIECPETPTVTPTPTSTATATSTVTATVTPTATATSKPTSVELVNLNASFNFFDWLRGLFQR